MYIFAVALQDGKWHHEESYSEERRRRPDTVDLWQKIRTVEDPAWTERYHRSNPSEKAFGGRVEIQMADGRVIEDELAVANAHPNSDRPFGREEYVDKLETLTEGCITTGERERFLELVDRLPELSAEEVRALTVQVSEDRLAHTAPTDEGLFK
jgi:2-methylcitrate dehydratase